MPVHRWNATLDGPFSEAALRAKIEAQGYRVARFVYPPGTVFPDHTHGIDKIDAVVAGRFRLVIGGHVALLGPGDWAQVPRGAVHNAAVIGDGPVVSLDAVRIASLSEPASGW
ncbi:MAG: cupin domain-containing protein [Acidobacteriota bacterium]